MAGFHVGQYACLGSLSIDGAPAFPLNCPAWDVVNLDLLWPAVSEIHRGQNLALPRITGRRGYPRRLDETVVRLIIWVRGDVNQTGVEFTTAPTPGWQGLYTNLTTLRNNAFSPVTTGDGTRACTLTPPVGSVVTADCQFSGLTPQGDVEDPNEAIYTFDLTITQGRFS